MGKTGCMKHASRNGLAFRNYSMIPMVFQGRLITCYYILEFKDGSIKKQNMHAIRLLFLTLCGTYLATKLVRCQVYIVGEVDLLCIPCIPTLGILLTNQVRVIDRFLIDILSRPRNHM